MEAAHRLVVHPLDQGVDLGGQGRHAVGGRAVGGQRADGGDADQGHLFGQVVGGEDGQVGRGGEARAEVAKVGVEEDGVVDQADQVTCALPSSGMRTKVPKA